jgi:hypothetical protein
MYRSLLVPGIIAINIDSGMVVELGSSSRRSVGFLVDSTAVRTNVMIEIFLALTIKLIFPVILYNYSSFYNDMNAETMYCVCI